MSVIGSNILAGAAGQGGGYVIDNSLRFRSSASAYLSRTPATTTNQKTWTISAWFKRGKLGVRQQLVTVGAGAGTLYFYVHFNSTDTLEVNTYNSSTGSIAWALITTQVFRDPSAWYHIVVSTDTTQATAADRVKIYINGSQITAFNTATYPSLNYDTRYNLNLASYINSYLGTGSFFDGYTAEFNSIDGQALTPSSFGDYNEDTNVWQPAKYAGSYGTNGFYLNFSDATTTTTLAEDSSGNGNDWTPNNISLTAGTTYDSMTDTPTIYADGGNYAVLNSLWGNANPPTFSNANLVASPSGSGYNNAISTIAVPASEYWYAEFTATANVPYGGGNNNAIGVVSTTRNTLSGSNYIGQFADTYGYFDGGRFYNNGSISQTAAAYATNDVIMIALGNGKLWWGKNGTWQGTGSPNPATATSPAFTGLTGDYFFGLMTYSSPYGGTLATNFGQRPFTYTPPTGFKSLHTGNLPDSAIENGSEYFAATTYTGNGTSQSITGLEFQPDFVWIKDRSAVRSHRLTDSVRGTEKALYSNLTNAEATEVGGVTAFNSNGFSVGSDSNYNANTDSFIGWQWKAGGAAVTNTAGSITSQVSASPTAGFSVVTYTGTGANATVGHGLGAAPKMVIVKARNASATDWPVYHVSVGNTGALLLNTTNQTSTSILWWNNTSPSSSVFTLGTIPASNTNTQTQVAYCFSEVPGYSSFGSYVGNGSDNGPFVYLGFRPKFVMIKRTDSAAGWYIFDASRSSFNVADDWIAANLSDAEISNLGYGVDLVSNGIKLRHNGVAVNTSGGTYIYMAFAENPFKNSLAR